MIVGTGIDIVEISRIESSMNRHGMRFAEKILAESELEELSLCSKRIQNHFVAKRFAAKEAAAKALGSGFSGGITMQQIVVVHIESGKPELKFSGAAAELCAKLNIINSHLSISDERSYAVASVILESK